MRLIRQTSKITFTLAVAIAACSTAVNAENLTWQQEKEAGTKALMASKPDFNLAVGSFGRAVQKAKAAGVKGQEFKTCLFNYGAALQEINKYDQSEKTLRELLAVEKQEKKETDYTANALVHLADISVAKNNLVEADRLYAQAIPIVRKTKPENSEYRAKDIFGYSDVKVRLGDYRAAIPLKEESLAILRKVPNGDKVLVAVVLEDLAETYNHLGQYEKAIKAANEAAIGFQKAGSKFDRGQADSLIEASVAYYLTNNSEKAQECAKKALALDTKGAGAKSLVVARDLVTQARSVMSLAESERLLKEAIAIYEAKEGKNSLGKAAALETLADRYRFAKQYSDSEKNYKACLAIRGKNPGSNETDTARTLYMLGSLYGLEKKFPDSEATFEKCYGIFRETKKLDHPFYGLALETQGDVFEQQGRYSEAQKKYKEALAIFQKNYSGNDLRIREAKDGISRVTALEAGKGGTK